MRFDRAWELRRPVFLGNALWVCAGGRLQLSVRSSMPDSYAGQMVQDIPRYMFANRRQVVQFKEGSQLRAGAPDAIFHGIFLHWPITSANTHVKLVT